MTNIDQKIEEEIEKFEKYKKEFVIESKPQSYIHIGLDYSFQFSDIENWLRTALTEIAEEANREERERIKDAIKKSKLSGLNKAIVYSLLTNKTE